MTSHVEVSNRRPHQGNILPSALRTCAQRAIDMCIYRRARDVGVVCCGRYAKKKQFSRWPHRADIRLEKLKQISSQAKATSDRTQANIKMLLNLSFNKNANWCHIRKHASRAVQKDGHGETSRGQQQAVGDTGSEQHLANIYWYFY